MTDPRAEMYRKTVALEIERMNDEDWRDRPLAGTGILIACALGILFYAIGLWAFGVL